MAFWDNTPGGAKNLRLYEPGHGWRQHDDQNDAEGRVSAFGAQRSIELALSSALNAGNLVMLTGAGSSFCATNPAGSLSAPGMADLWDAVEAAASPALMREIIALIPNAAGIDKNIEKLLTLSKLYIALFNDPNSAKIAGFIRVAERAILARADFVSAATNILSHRAVVRKIARRGIRKSRTKIFTTNYDLCFEQAASPQQFVIIDGFSHSTPQTYDRAHFSYDIVRRSPEGEPPNYIENVFQLYKLHGSIDWRRVGTTIIRSRDAAVGDPVLIYPRESKYQEAFDTPYLDMMAALQSALREPDTTLLVCGFGFNDDHIGKPIMAAIEANMSLNIIVCDVVFLQDDSLLPNPRLIDEAAPMRLDNSYFKRLFALARDGDKRILLLNGRFEDFADALPDLVAQTERERHTERMLRLQDAAIARDEA